MKNTEINWKNHPSKVIISDRKQIPFKLNTIRLQRISLQKVNIGGHLDSILDGN